jgi:hypothetical protein
MRMREYFRILAFFPRAELIESQELCGIRNTNL